MMTIMMMMMMMMIDNDDDGGGGGGGIDSRGDTISFRFLSLLGAEKLC